MGPETQLAAVWLLAAAYLGAWVLADTIKTLTHRAPARHPGDRPLDRLGLPVRAPQKATAVYGMLAATTPR